MAQEFEKEYGEILVIYDNCCMETGAVDVQFKPTEATELYPQQQAQLNQLLQGHWIARGVEETERHVKVSSANRRCCLRSLFNS